MARILRRFALDVAIWYGIAAVFLWIYVGHYARPATAIGPHLRLLALPLLTVLLLRLVLGDLSRGRAAVDQLTGGRDATRTVSLRQFVTTCPTDVVTKRRH